VGVKARSILRRHHFPARLLPRLPSAQRARPPPRSSRPPPRRSRSRSTLSSSRVEKKRKRQRFLPFSPLNLHLHPISMRQMVKIFSTSVLGETLPKPTEVSPVIVK